PPVAFRRVRPGILPYPAWCTGRAPDGRPSESNGSSARRRAEATHVRVSAGNKVVLIGAGDVGVAYAYALVNQGIVGHLAIIDIDERKTGGNVMDLNHGVVWAPSRTKVTSGTYADCAGAALVVRCAGAAQKPGGTRPP